MASKGMTMNAVIKLTATQFNAGIKQVQRSLNSLKSTFLQIAGALGAGLGLGSLLNEIKNTATQLSIAKATLENVAENGTKYGENAAKGVKDLTKASAEYASNLEFLKRISNEYGQSVLGITQAFAKFRAAAGYAGVSLTEIKRIFEALTKAAGAYHLTAEQTANAMMAVEQMFSKGKVTSEELRRQLGNALPGAFGLMAKAAGMTTGEFEKAMKAGQILAADVLPKFADELNKVTQGANFDSLQSSLNRFSNSWVEFTEKINFEGLFQKIVDGGSKALTFIADNFKQIAQTAISVISGIAGGKAFRKLEEEGSKAVKGIQKEYATLERKNIQLTNQVGKLAKSYTDAGNAAASLSGARIDIEGLTAAEASAAGLNQGLVNIIANNEKMGKVVPKYSLQAADAQKVYAHRISETNKAIKQNEQSMQQFSRTIQLAGTKGGVALVGLQRAATAAGQAIKAAMASIAFGAIITILTQVISKLMDILSFSNKLKKQAEEINKEAHTISSEVNTQIAEAKNLASIINDTSTTEAKRKGSLKKLNELLGLSGEKALTFKSTADDINTAIQKWSDNIIKAAQRMAMLNKIGELTTRNLEIDQEIDDANSKKKWYNTGWINGKIERLQKEKEQNEKLIKKLTEESNILSGEMDFSGDSGGSGGSGGGAGSGGVLDKLKKSIDDYKQKLKELQNQEKNGAITKEEYYQESGKLAEKTWKEIATVENFEGELKKLGQEYVELGETIREVGTIYAGYDERKKKLEEEKKEAEKLQKEYERVKNKFNEIVDPGNLPQKKQRNTFFDYKKSNKDIFDENADNIEDYLSKLESLRDKLEDLKSDAGEAWSSEMQTFLDLLIEKLGRVSNEAKSVREQANFAELAEDIKKMNSELSKTTFDNIKNTAHAFHSLSESVINLGKAMDELTDHERTEQEEEEYKKFKALISVLDELFQMYNTVSSAVKMFTEAEEKRAALEKAVAAQDSLVSATRVAEKEALTAAETTLGTTTTAMESAQQAAIIKTAAAETTSAPAVMAAETAKQGAVAATTTVLGGEAVAGAAASQASVPYIGPILAAAAVAGIVALLLSNMQKFASGGIIGGNSYSGDKNVARVNSGEMILNKSQQGHLWNMLTGKEGVGGGQVEFVLRGDRLLGAINNYQSRRRG